MIGICESILYDLPCVFPLNTVLVNKYPHKLRDTDNGMCIVKLDGIILGKILHIVAVCSLVLSYDILKRSGYEEILLSYTKNLTVVGNIVRIKNSPNIIYSVSLDNGIVKSLGIKEIEVKLLSGLSLPEP